MPVDAQGVRDEIVLEVGDVDPVTGDTPTDPADGVLYNRVDWLWDRFAAKDRIAPGLREMYVKRSCLRIILAVLAQKRFDVTDVLAGFGMKANQVWDHYNSLYECVKAEIEVAERKYGASVTPVGSRLRTRAPVRALFPPDGNSPRYGGDLYTRRTYRAVRR